MHVRGAFCSRLASDYILFLTADVDVISNTNETCDYKYVDQAEIQSMLDDQGTELLSNV